MRRVGRRTEWRGGAGARPGGVGLARTEMMKVLVRRLVCWHTLGVRRRGEKTRRRRQSFWRM